MKYLLLLITPLLAFASSNTLTPMEHNSIHGYNKKPLAKMQQKRNMHKLHKVDDKEVRSIANKETAEEIKSVKLTHRGNILKYIVKTENYTITINALDGKILDKVKKN